MAFPTPEPSSLPRWRSGRERLLELVRFTASSAACDPTDTSLSGRKALVETLETLEREERARGLARPRHWAYVPARHAGLIECLRRERAELAALEVGESQIPRPPATSTVTPVT